MRRNSYNYYWAVALVLLLKMVDKSTSPLQTHFGPVFGDEAVQTTLLFLEWGSIRALLRTFTHLPATWHSNRIWLRPLSSVSWQQWAREYLACCPSSGGSASCHRRRTLPVALRRPFACAGYFLRTSLKSSSIWSPGSLRLSCSSLPCRGIPLGTSVQEISIMHAIEGTSLPK